MDEAQVKAILEAADILADDAEATITALHDEGLHTMANDLSTSINDYRMKREVLQSV
jgi:hypothetical protein